MRLIDTKDEIQSMGVVVEKHSKPLTSSVPAFSPSLEESKITSPRCMRVHSVHYGHLMHNDIYTKARCETVCSLIDGMMEDIGCEKVYGNRVRNFYGEGVRSSYSHHSEAHVRRGCQVSSGHPIGISAKRAEASGPSPTSLSYLNLNKRMFI